MKKILKITTMAFAVALFATAEVVGQQLPQFSQYIFNGLHINPAYAGYKTQGYIQSTYRNQWVSFPGAPQTFTVTADLSANEGMMGFGASFLTDRIGPAETSTALLTYSYRIQTGKESFLSLGVSGGASQYAIDGDWEFNDPNDPNIPEGRINTWTPNLNAGLFFNTNRFCNFC